MKRILIRLVFGLALRLSAVWPWFGRLLNRLGINGIVNKARSRPHPWSTAHDYISWTSLTDQRYSARHLPAVEPGPLPAVGDVSKLFKRSAGQRLDEKSTCLFPTFAQYLTDGFIRTRMPNTSKGDPESLRLQNTSNHQIDLCPLYGRNVLQTTALREKSADPARRGRLKSQMLDQEEHAPFLFNADGSAKPEFADLDPPLGVDNVTDPGRKAKLFAFGGDRANTVPQVAAMNTLLLREHNRLAGELARINTDWDDDRVFETARIILIVIFIKIVVEEYINHISPSPIPFTMDAAVAQRAPWNRPNWITTEFSLLYRWHSLVPDQLTFGGTVYAIPQIMMNNGPFLEGGLRRMFVDLSSQKAGQLGPFNTADALVAVEEASIRQGRLSKLAPYVDYRKYVSLPRPDTFEDISSNPEVVAVLKSAYRKVEDVEFFVGLFAEDPVPNSTLSPLILAMVAIDAFSQALTNPLLSEHVFKPTTFTEFGWNEIHRTRSISDLVDRNSPSVPERQRITMTQPGWTYRW